MLEKAMSKEVDNDIFVVLRNNESQVSSRNTKLWAVLQIKFYIENIKVG